MIARLTSLAALGCLVGSAAASAQPNEKPWYRPDDFSKWSFAVSLAATNAAVDIVDSEVVLPDELDVGDFEVTLDDDLSVSSTIVSGSVGYRVLPFLQVSVLAGLASSKSETGFVITGTPTGNFSDLFSGPISFDSDTSLDTEGYSLGLSATAYAPLADIGRDKLAAYAGFLYAWNRYEDDEIVAEASRTSFGFVFPLDEERADRIVYRLSGSYNWLSREIERSQLIAGEVVDVKITQEYENPWGVELGAGIPISRNVVLGISASHRLSGETSTFASILYRFD